MNKSDVTAAAAKAAEDVHMSLLRMVFLEKCAVPDREGLEEYIRSLWPDLAHEIRLWYNARIV